MKSKFHNLDIDGELVHIKQSGKNFRVIKPYKNPDGSINWFNLLTGGSWMNLIITTVIVIVVLGTLNEYSTNINTLLDCFRIPNQLPICIEAFSPEALKPINP